MGAYRIGTLNYNFLTERSNPLNINWNEIFAFMNIEPGWLQVTVRLLVAMLVGLVIGMEREYTNRPAGLRTHILVALGACVVAITGEMVVAHYRALGSNSDPARLAAQVISGVGFLGAGTILRDGATVKGLTTAASLWAVACLGIAAGFGYHFVALAGMVLIFVTLTILEVLQNKFMSNHSTTFEYELETNDIATVLSLINDDAISEQASIHHLHAKQLPNSCYRVTFQAKFGGGRGKQRHQHFFQTLVSAPEIQSVRQSDTPVRSGHK